MRKNMLTKCVALLLSMAAALSVTACGLRHAVSDPGSGLAEGEGRVEVAAEPGKEIRETAPTAGAAGAGRKEEQGDSWQRFFRKTFRQALSEAGDANRIYSPVNLYLCLAMLSEVSVGDTRKQIVDVLGQEEQEKIRKQSETLYWDTNHFLTCRVGELPAEQDYTCRVGNSLWLDSEFPFQKKRLRLLEEYYFADCFQEKMGTAAADRKMRQWVDDVTGGKLQEQTEEIQTGPNTVMTLLSCTEFESAWKKRFSKRETTKDTFYEVRDGANADAGNDKEGEVVCDFLHQTLQTRVLSADGYMAVRLPMQNGVSMYVVLPDRGIAPADLLKEGKGEDLLRFCMGYNENVKKAGVDFSMPKFDIGSRLELQETLESMGVIDMFRENEADFSPLSGRGGDCIVTGIYADHINQASNMKVDENGCSAASYTEAEVTSKASAPQKQYTMKCNRPFLFFVTKENTGGRGGIPILAGALQNPGKGGSL